MPIVVATQLRKSFGTLHVLDGVSVSITRGERVGLVGLNGSGKTTLARILAGVDQVDDGTVAVKRDAQVAYLPQDVRFTDGMTAREVVMTGLAEWNEAIKHHQAICAAVGRETGPLDELVQQQAAAALEVERLGGWDRMHVADAILGYIGLKRLDEPVQTLSGGDKRRVALARILVSQPDLAVLDEPSNHLDVDTIAWLESFLIDTYRGALLIITHDRYLLDRVVTRTLEIENGNLHSYPGGYESYLEAKDERLQLQARTESNRQNLLRTELQWLRRQPKARTGKQKARIKRVEEAAAVQAPKSERTVKLAMDTMRLGKTILELHQVELQRGGKTLAKGVSLLLNPNDRLGIVGPNGIGKTSLLQCIVGQLVPSDGKVVLGKNSRIAYFDQHRGGLDPSQSVFDNVAGPRSKITLGAKDMDVHAYLERFLFTKAAMYQPVEALSGGEKARVALAKMLSHGANLLLLDEPTNDLDVATLSAVESWLVEFDGAVVVVTHDRWFLNRVATSILAFEGDGKVRVYAGNYDDYCEQRQADTQEQEKQRAAQSAAKLPAKPAAKPRALTYAERIELEGLPERIEQGESELKRLQEQLADPRLYAERLHEVKGLQQQLQVVQAGVDALMERWELLETKQQS